MKTLKATLLFVALSLPLWPTGSVAAKSYSSVLYARLV
jgi:hypothetical protein